MTVNTSDARPVLKHFADKELARRHLPDFCRLMDDKYEATRHTALLCDHLEALERRDIERLAVFMPPRHSKSYHVSQRFPAWFLGRNPDQLVKLASYGADLAESNSRKVRALVRDKQRWPFSVSVSGDSFAVNLWHTANSAGEVGAVGVGGPLTGMGADLLVVDDPFKGPDDSGSALQRDRVWDWYTQVADTRMQPNGVQLLTQTRWHDDDLAGRILNSPLGSTWTVLTLPAIAVDEDALGRGPGEALWPERFPLDRLEQLRKTMGSKSFNALYQQDPLPIKGTMFQPEWFERRYNALPARSTLAIIQTIDSAWRTGVSNDWSVIATWATDGLDYYLIDVFRKRLEYVDLRKAVQDKFAEQQPLKIYCEDASSGLALISELRRTTNLPIIGVPPRGSKQSRAEMATPYFEATRVVLPREAPWLDAWIAEHLRFPNGKHDDQVDTTAMAIIFLNQSITRRPKRERFSSLSSWFVR